MRRGVLARTMYVWGHIIRNLGIARGVLGTGDRTFLNFAKGLGSTGCFWPFAAAPRLIIPFA